MQPISNPGDAIANAVASRLASTDRSTKKPKGECANDVYECENDGFECPSGKFDCGTNGVFRCYQKFSE